MSWVDVIKQIDRVAEQIKIEEAKEQGGGRVELKSIQEPDVYVLPMIRMAYKVDIIPPLRENDYIRVTRLVDDFCVVKEAYYSVRELERKRLADLNQLYFLGVGTYTHSWIWRYLDGLCGTWRCQKCNAVYTTQTAECKCGGNTEYELPEYVNDEHKVKGIPDAIIKRGDQQILLEVKTVERAMFWTQKRQDRAILQLNLYMWLTGIREGRVLVFFREAPNKSVEFSVEYDWQKVIKVLDDLKLTREYIRQKMVPWHLGEECDNKTCELKNYCRKGGD